jgi:hypothetical protein
MSNLHPIFEALLAPFAPKPDPRDPDNSRSGIFRYHNCSYCNDGELPCRQGAPNRCDYLRARND